MATIDDCTDARWMLSLTLVLGLLLLGLQAFYCLTGDTETDAPWLYVLLMAAIVVVNSVALITVGKYLVATAYGFCLSVVVAILFMAFAAHQMLAPIVLVIFPICACGVAYFTNTRQMLPFLVLTVGTLLALGVAAGAVWEAVPSITSSVIWSIAVSRLRARLCETRAEVRGVIKVLEERGRRNKEHLRRITEINSH